MFYVESQRLEIGREIRNVPVIELNRLVVPLPR